jgi:hypothetical protein
VSGEPELTAPAGMEPIEAAPAPVDETPAPIEATEPLEDIPAEERGKIGAIIELRKELKALKPLAEKATQLESELNQLRPYAEFVKSNPHLLQPQAPPAPPPVEPKNDPELVAYAREMELYDPQTGMPDVGRAASIRDRIKRDAVMAAAEMMRPVQEQTYETRAAANLQGVAQMQDAHGRPIAGATIQAVVGKLAAGLGNTANPKGELLRLLADPQVIANVIAPAAYAAQSQSTKPAPAAPSPALDVEAPGGASPVTLSAESLRRARDAGISEKAATEAARRYVPGRSNVLE